MIFINQKQKKSVLLGNGVNIQFGGKAYSNRFILSRIVANARCDKYDDLFEGTLSGKEIEKLFRMTKFTDEGALRFARKLRAMGIDDKLLEMGAKYGDKVQIMDLIFEFKE